LILLSIAGQEILDLDSIEQRFHRDVLRRRWRRKNCQEKSRGRHCDASWFHSISPRWSADVPRELKQRRRDWRLNDRPPVSLPAARRYAILD
jgi:hypothetical protein